MSLVRKDCKQAHQRFPSSEALKLCRLEAKRFGEGLCRRYESSHSVQSSKHHLLVGTLNENRLGLSVPAWV